MGKRGVYMNKKSLILKGEGFMKKYLLVITVIAAAWISGSCSKEVDNEWSSTSAELKNFCGGTIYINKIETTYGVNVEVSGLNPKLYFSDMQSYTPGEPCEPKDTEKKHKKHKKGKKNTDEEDASDEESSSENDSSVCFSIAPIKSVEDINKAMKDGGLELLGQVYADIISKAEPTQTTAKCEVTVSLADKCTSIKDGSYACSATIVCDGDYINVTNIFKVDGAAECPEASLILAELGGDQNVVVPDKTKKEKPKKDTPKKDVPQKDVPQKDVPQKEVPNKETPKKDRPILMIMPPSLF